MVKLEIVGMACGSCFASGLLVVRGGSGVTVVKETEVSSCH